MVFLSLVASALALTGTYQYDVEFGSKVDVLSFRSGETVGEPDLEEHPMQYRVSGESTHSWRGEPSPVTWQLTAGLDCSVSQSTATCAADLRLSDGSVVFAVSSARTSLVIDLASGEATLTTTQSLTLTAAEAGLLAEWVHEVAGLVADGHPAWEQDGSSRTARVSASTSGFRIKYTP